MLRRGELTPLRQEGEAVNNLSIKCKGCRQAFTPRKADQKYCSARCRQKAYRQRLERLRPKAKSNGEPFLYPTNCLYCRGTFWAKRERAVYCSTSCRTLSHHRLKEAMPEALEVAYGIPRMKAMDIVETQPVWKVRTLLHDLGFSYSHQVRAWVKGAVD